MSRAPKKRRLTQSSSDSENDRDLFDLSDDQPDPVNLQVDLSIDQSMNPVEATNMDISITNASLLELSVIKQGCPMFNLSQESQIVSTQESDLDNTQGIHQTLDFLGNLSEANDSLNQLCTQPETEPSTSDDEEQKQIAMSQTSSQPDKILSTSLPCVNDICDYAANVLKGVHMHSFIDYNKTLPSSEHGAPDEKLLSPETSQHDRTEDDAFEEISAYGTPSKQHYSGVHESDRMRLLLNLLGTASKAKCSTPRKGAAPSFSFTVLSPLREENESDTSSQDSESENSDEDGSLFSSVSVQSHSDEDCSLPEVAVNESFLVNLSQQSNTEDLNESISTRIPYQAHLYNNIKIHNYSDLSVNEGILKIMLLYIKNKLSKAGLQRTIASMCDFIPENHNFPTSSHLILEYIKNLAPPVPATKHFYCQQCLYYHGTEIIADCEICHETTFGHFHIFDVAALIKFFFENHNLATIMDQEERRNSNLPGIRSMKDGSVYKYLNCDRGKYDVNLILNADGVRIRKGSTKELWVAMFTIVEVPVHLQKFFVTVVGVWYDTVSPDMKTFLKPFAEQMETLEKSGVKWTHPASKEDHVSHVHLPVVVEDAPARAKTQNLMHFNSCYGCSLCEIKAQQSHVVVGTEVKCVRRFHYVHDPQLRTKERMLNQAASVGNKKHKKGVKGLCVLNSIPSVDVSKCFVPEYMHSVLIGSCKRVLEIWTSKAGDWSIKDEIFIIDGFLNSCKHPSFIHRSKRQLKSLSYWKASDFYYFMLFEALPALRNHLPDVYFQHFILLVLGIFKLLKTCISESDLEEADLLLRLYVIDYERLYGDKELTYNLHQLTHLAMCVRWYGPLHCWSAFNYEDMNGIIARATHGTNHVDVEIINNIKISQGIHMLKNIVQEPEDFVESVDISSRIALIGKEITNIVLSAEELQMLGDDCPTLYARAKLGYDEFTSELYKCLQSENFYVMWTENGNVKYGSIKYFAVTRDDQLVVIRVLHIDHTKVFCNRDALKSVEHFIPVERTQVNVAVKLKDIVTSIVKVGKIGGYIYKRPNLFRYIL